MAGKDSEGREILEAARSLADAVEGDARHELKRAGDARDACEGELAVALVKVWSDPDLWVRGPGRTWVLNTRGSEARRRINRARRESFAIIDACYARMERALLPRAARGLEP